MFICTVMLSAFPNPTSRKDFEAEEEYPYLYQTSDPLPSVILIYSLKFNKTGSDIKC